MTANAPAKFLFDIDFAPAPKAPTAMPVSEHKTLLAEAETRGYRNGFQAAETEMRADAARRLAVALEQIGRTLDQLASGLPAIESRLETEAVEVAVSVANKLSPALIAREPFAEIAALVTECFRHLVAAPHVVIRIGEKIYPSAREKLEEIARQRGFEGRLVVLAEPDIAEGDCRIEWADGGINRDRAAAAALIADTVKRFVSARASGADSFLKGLSHE